MHPDYNSERLQLLLDGLSASGWVEVERKQIARSDDRSSFSWLLARRDRARLFLYEAAVGRRFPRYTERRGLRSALALLEEDLLLITDAAHREFVLVTQLEAATRDVCVEERLAVEPGELSRLLGRPREPASRAAFTMDIALRSDAELSVARFVYSHVDEECSGPDSDPANLIGWIEGITDPAQVRTLWRVLTKVVVLDLHCQNANWLLSAAAFLETCYVATLGRMTSFLIDDAAQRHLQNHLHESLSSAPDKPDDEQVRESLRRLRDLSAILVAFRGDSLGGLSRKLIRRTIVRRQIVGLARTRTESNASRRALLAFTGETRHLVPSLDANCRVALDPQCLLSDGATRDSPPAKPGESKRTPVPRPTTAGAAPVEVEVYAKAWRLMIDARDSDQWTLAEWRSAARDLSRLRRRVERRVEGPSGVVRPRRVVGLDLRLIVPCFGPDRYPLIRDA